MDGHAKSDVEDLGIHDVNKMVVWKLRILLLYTYNICLCVCLFWQVAFLNLCEKELNVVLRLEMAQILQRTSHRHCLRRYFVFKQESLWSPFLPATHSSSVRIYAHPLISTLNSWAISLRRFVSNGGLKTLLVWLTAPDSPEELLRSLLTSLMTLIFLIPSLPEAAALIEEAKCIAEVAILTYVVYSLFSRTLLYVGALFIPLISLYIYMYMYVCMHVRRMHIILKLS